MNILKIVVFALILTLSKVAAGVLVLRAVGVDAYESHLALQYAVSVVVSIGVFAYVSKAGFHRPYITALVIGLLSEVIAVTVSALLFGQIFWGYLKPQFEIPALIFAALVGVKLGSQFRRRSAD